MVKKIVGSGMNPKQSTPEKLNESSPKREEINDLLKQVEMLHEKGEAKQALECVLHAKLESAWVTNALGVCLLRLGKIKEAVEVFRGLVLKNVGNQLRLDVPVVFKTNFAVALLMDNNLSGCLSALAEIKEVHPAVEKLTQAIERWRKNLNLWQRFNWYMGAQPNQPVVLVFPPGDLE